MSMLITASMLYDLVRCPQRLALDIFEDPARRDPVNPFVQLLWEKGHAFERETIESIELPFTDLKSFSGAERERLTLEAMRQGDPLIYGGRIAADDLLGDPDLLRRQGKGYVAGDIKSGAGEEGATEETDGRPKKHYAVQIALYTDILERLGICGGRTPFIWDVHRAEVVYELDELHGIRNQATRWDIYRSYLEEARRIAGRLIEPLPALAGICKLCHWRTLCTKFLVERDDLTLIPELGRSRRDPLTAHFRTVEDLAQADLKRYIRGGKTLIPGIGPETLSKFRARALLQKKPGAKPYLKDLVNLPRTETEIFFDIETDPMRDICYLHGFVEQRGGNTTGERYLAFFTETPTPEGEERAFSEAWAYLRRSRPCAIYYYSPYERTNWRKLQKRYPHVATEEEIEMLFADESTVDLYTDIVRPKTEWPTRDYSIKTLASFLGFKWRDTNPSGAASVEWYHRWIESGDPEIRQRILDYNEDDCVATRVLLDGIRSLPLFEVQ
jgi:predicted RecB family nuclease